MRVRQEDESPDPKYYCELFPGIAAGIGAVVVTTGGGVTAAAFCTGRFSAAEAGLVLAFSISGGETAFGWAAIGTAAAGED